VQASKHPADEVGECLAGIIAGCLVELRVGVLRGSYCSGMLSGTPCRGAAGFILGCSVELRVGVLRGL
jgi:hypothetical protein